MPLFCTHWGKQACTAGAANLRRWGLLWGQCRTVQQRLSRWQCAAARAPTYLCSAEVHSCCVSLGLEDALSLQAPCCQGVAARCHHPGHGVRPRLRLAQRLPGQVAGGAEVSTAQRKQLQWRAGRGGGGTGPGRVHTALPRWMVPHHVQTEGVGYTEHAAPWMPDTALSGGVVGARARGGTAAAAIGKGRLDGDGDAGDATGAMHTCSGSPNHDIFRSSSAVLTAVLTDAWYIHCVPSAALASVLQGPLVQCACSSMNPK
jgi:hypothetical protein